MTPGRSHGPSRVSTVLVVEDEPGVLSLTRRVLERAGFRVIGQAEPTAALDWWADVSRRESVDLVLADVVMPSMSGPEMLKRMLITRPGLVVLLMSGNDPGSTPHPFIGKPFTPADLVSAVRALLDQRSEPA
jgi:two-component system, cell cycle sensor histidine kinase and response regulator CckA